MDITDLILHDHHEQRRLFSYLDDIERGNHDSLAAVWSRLRILLEVHAEAEERFFYPRLLEVGRGTDGSGSPKDEVTDVIKDHNEIRDACREADEAAVGSGGWWEAVAKANEANSDHMGEEEREDLVDFRRHASLQDRHDIAVAFTTFMANHRDGVEAVDKDPQRYVTENS